jgi:hypothetical protein
MVNIIQEHTELLIYLIPKKAKKFFNYFKKDSKENYSLLLAEVLPLDKIIKLSGMEYTIKPIPQVDPVILDTLILLILIELNLNWL